MAKNIEETIQQLSVPVIVKEVGFGMSKETIQQLQLLGAQAADVSGRGGTSFSQIENARRKNVNWTIWMIGVNQQLSHC